MSSPSGAVSTLIGLSSFAGPALDAQHDPRVPTRNSREARFIDAVRQDSLQSRVPFQSIDRNALPGLSKCLADIEHLELRAIAKAVFTRREYYRTWDESPSSVLIYDFHCVAKWICWPGSNKANRVPVWATLLCHRGKAFPLPLEIVVSMDDEFAVKPTISHLY